ncbi:MAG: hypothetical protein N5P05_002777 [Chroococcopsis gigantea SAG 12.99]|jgi:hypothetical protein|nr:hypothetical protein [Chroococcopsis gigantea SAG 12.99]
MVVGKILWFGGENNKKGKKNNFGFISYFDKQQGQQRKIYVNRAQVPGELQELFEKGKDNGQGIFGDFEIRPRGEDEEAIDLRLHGELGIVYKTSQSDSRFILSLNQRDRFTYDEPSLDVGDIVSYTVREYEEILEIKVEKNISYPQVIISISKVQPQKIEAEIIKERALSTNDIVRNTFLKLYLDKTAPSEAADFIAISLQYFPDCEIYGVGSAKQVMMTKFMDAENDKIAEKYIW